MLHRLFGKSEGQLNEIWKYKEFSTAKKVYDDKVSIVRTVEKWPRYIEGAL